MKVSSALAGLALFAASVQAGGLVIEQNLPEGHTIAPMTVTYQVNGQDVVKQGSIQEVVAQIQLDDPTFEVTAISRASRSALTEAALYCCPIGGRNYAPASLVRIYEGMDYLNSVSAACSAGATSCVRVSCSWDSAIYLCNDNSYTVSMGCGWISTMVGYILSGCNASVNGACGQVFDTDNYDVIITADTC